MVGTYPGVGEVTSSMTRAWTVGGLEEADVDGRLGEVPGREESCAVPGRDPSKIALAPSI